MTSHRILTTIIVITICGTAIAVGCQIASGADSASASHGASR